MNLYAFDVDETLEVSKGPIPLKLLEYLHREGEIVGLCGNWAAVTMQDPDWHRYISFLGPVGLSKAEFLGQIQRYAPHADDYIMVGNVMGISGDSDDRGAAREAGWRFIQEIDFARGER